MIKDVNNLQSLQAKENLWHKGKNVEHLASVFSSHTESFINEITLFMVHFNAIPNVIDLNNINCKKAMQWFIQNYSPIIKDVYFNKRTLSGNKNAVYDDVLYLLHDDLIVYFDHNLSFVKLLFRNTDILVIEKMESALKKFIKKKDGQKPEISLIIQTQFGLSTNNLTISKPLLKIVDNYNDDFNEIHHIISKQLTKKNGKGLVLLHGKPGTGKTSYLRYLITQVKKKVIFLPPNLAGTITNPTLMNLLMENPNSIFVIEDAENIVVDRERNGESPVSALLNITDGLLSDCMNIQIICSFNTDLSKVDNALMRKGRLIAKYEFKELATNKAQALSNKLGFNSIIDKPMNLAAIYNQEEKEFLPEKNFTRIGFLAGVNN